MDNKNYESDKTSQHQIVFKRKHASQTDEDYDGLFPAANLAKAAEKRSEPGITQPLKSSQMSMASIKSGNEYMTKTNPVDAS